MNWKKRYEPSFKRGQKVKFIGFCDNTTENDDDYNKMIIGEIYTLTDVHSDSSVVSFFHIGELPNIELYPCEVEFA